MVNVEDKDFEVSVGNDAVSVRSASRVGDSDFGVNAKRRRLSGFQSDKKQTSSS